MHKFVIVIGRFEPAHNAHLELFRFALSHGEKLIIVLGSDNQSKDTMNPWSSDERAQMIRSAFSEKENASVEFIYAKDYESNSMWLASVQAAIDNIIGDETDVKLVGHKKDASSFYLKSFPQWGDYIESFLSSPTSATKVRECVFRKDKVDLKTMVPPGVYDFISAWMETPEFARLYDEFREIMELEEERRGSKWPIISVTTDAIVVCSGHVLVVRRGGRYGKGLLAWPGGYIAEDETLIKSCIRELKEETAITLTEEELKKFLVDQDVFDAPWRDKRGRVITHAYYFELPDGKLPRVKGMDDADKAHWMTLNDFYANESRFFADHHRMGCRFINKAHKNSRFVY